MMAASGLLVAEVISETFSIPVTGPDRVVVALDTSGQNVAVTVKVKNTGTDPAVHSPFEVRLHGVTGEQEIAFLNVGEPRAYFQVPDIFRVRFFFPFVGPAIKRAECSYEIKVLVPVNS